MEDRFKFEAWFAAFQHETQISYSERVKSKIWHCSYHGVYTSKATHRRVRPSKHHGACYAFVEAEVLDNGQIRVTYFNEHSHPVHLRNIQLSKATIATIKTMAQQRVPDRDIMQHIRTGALPNSREAIVNMKDIANHAKAVRPGRLHEDDANSVSYPKPGAFDWQEQQALRTQYRLKLQSFAHQVQEQLDAVSSMSLAQLMHITNSLKLVLDCFLVIGDQSAMDNEMEDEALLDEMLLDGDDGADSDETQPLFDSPRHGSALTTALHLGAPIHHHLESRERQETAKRMSSTTSITLAKKKKKVARSLIGNVSTQDALDHIQSLPQT
eukprot:m.25644 g.25644  ORF g.25644 m.25644 type:complete len:326 (-) comp11615_c0_seq4:151-1128(-)